MQLSNVEPARSYVTTTGIILHSFYFVSHGDLQICMF